MTDNMNTADLVKRLRECSSDEAMWSRQAADRIEQLEAALTRANAATAAAYEVAAREVECGCGAGPCQDTANCAAKDAAAIRSLATPDQTAALDKLIAEAEARVWAGSEKIARGYSAEWEMFGFSKGAKIIGDAILAASKKGGV